MMRLPPTLIKLAMMSLLTMALHLPVPKIQLNGPVHCIKTLMELGKCALPAEPDSLRRPIGQNMNGNKMTESDSVGTSSSNGPLDDTDIDASYHYTEAIAANISFRAKILQEWLQRIVETKQPMSNCDAIMNETSECTQSVALQELSTRCCATLESQITELVTCRTELIQRERRLRRNIFRMALNLLTPDQVVNSAMLRPDDISSNHNNDVDDIETAVHLEKQELLRLQKEHQELLESISATTSMQSSSTLNQGEVSSVYTENHHASHLLSKRIEENQIKITQLEDSLHCRFSISVLKIQLTGRLFVITVNTSELNELLKEKEAEITLLSQRQLSDEDHHSDNYPMKIV